jgi:chromosome partitioning protein
VKVIALAQQKGGVGKSTLAIHMAVELVHRKKVVAIIDLDPQASVAKWANRREAVQPIVVASENAQLGKHLAKFKDEGFDFVILDLPGRRAPAVTDGIKVADLVIIPARPLDMDIEASGETLGTVQRLRKKYAFVMSIAPAQGARTKDFATALEAHGHTVLPVFVIERLALPDAIAEGLGVVEYQPKGKAAIEIAAFTDAVLERTE